MPSSCCLPGCKGNYKTGPRVTVFKFPDRNKCPDIYKKWHHAVKRDNFIPNKNTKVCEKHFTENEIQRTTEAFDEKAGKLLIVPLQVPRLIPGAVPSLYPDLPSYLSSSIPATSRECPDSKRRKRESLAVENAIRVSTEQHEQYETARRVSSLCDLKNKINCLKKSEWQQFIGSDNVCLYKMVIHPHPRIVLSVVIDSELQVKVHVEGAQIFKLHNKEFSTKIGTLNDLEYLIDELELFYNGEISNEPNCIEIAVSILEKCNNESLPFIIEQLLLIHKNPNARRYTWETMVFASLLFNLAPHAYKFIRQAGFIILPHESTIHSLSLKFDVNPRKEQEKSNFLLYAKRKFTFLEENDKIVNLLMDEIYVKKFWDYKGGTVVGACNDTVECAGSAHVFMVSSLKSKFKDVVHILPVSSITGEILHKIVKEIIMELECIGYKVVAVISDNNSINSKAMSYFTIPPQKKIVYPHPCDRTRPLFFILDSVHLIKSIRNCWVKKKNDGQCMVYPSFPTEGSSNESAADQIASLHTLKKLHHMEVNSLAKFGYTLSLKSLDPSNLERQNVRLALQVFNEHVVNGLLDVGTSANLPHFEQTATYIKIICRWWQIVNVRSHLTGNRLNNAFQTPFIDDVSDKKHVFLTQFLDWLDNWEKISNCNGKLSKETHSALKHTTYAIMEVASYLSNEMGFEYILPGKFQTDNLESRFGMYRQLAGSQFHISLRQIYECETKLRLHSELKMNLSSKKYGDIPFEPIPNVAKDTNTVEQHNLTIEVIPSDFEEAEDCIPVLIYIAGYCTFAAVKSLKCDDCRNRLLLNKQLPANESYSLIYKMSRGALAYPKDYAISIVTTNYIVVKKLCFEREVEFLQLRNQRAVAAALTVQNLIMPDEAACVNEHDINLITRKIVWTSTNCFLNNYCKKQNDMIRDKSNKRKLQIFCQ